MEAHLDPFWKGWLPGMLQTGESLTVQCANRQEVEVLEFSRLLGGSGGVPWQKIAREGWTFFFFRRSWLKGRLQVCWVEFCFRGESNLVWKWILSNRLKSQLKKNKESQTSLFFFNLASIKVALSFKKHQVGWYCWWTKSCTTKDDDYPIIHRVLTIPGGAWFCPSTVSLH